MSCSSSHQMTLSELTLQPTAPHGGRRCQGTIVQGKHKGKKCNLHAMKGGTYCQHHGPMAPKAHLHTSKRKRFTSVLEYLASLPKLPATFGNFGDLRPIAKACDCPLSEVRAGLQKAGYERSTTNNSVPCWKLKK